MKFNENMQGFGALLAITGIVFLAFGNQNLGLSLFSVGALLFLGSIFYSKPPSSVSADHGEGDDDSDDDSDSDDGDSDDGGDDGGDGDGDGE